MFEQPPKHPEGSRKVLALAQEEAVHLNHAYVGTEHLLLGLLWARYGIAARVLSRLGVDLSKTRSAVEFLILCRSVAL